MGFATQKALGDARTALNGALADLAFRPRSPAPPAPRPPNRDRDG